MSLKLRSKRHQSVTALLERKDLDAVLAFTDNRASAELGARALRHGLPTMVEKPMAADLPGADALLNAARASGDKAKEKALI